MPTPALGYACHTVGVSNPRRAWVGVIRFCGAELGGVAGHAQDLLVVRGLRIGGAMAVVGARPRAVASSRNASASDGAPQRLEGGVRTDSADWWRVAPTRAFVRSERDVGGDANSSALDVSRARIT